MPSKGVARRLGKRKREHNRRRREGRALRYAPAVQAAPPALLRCACGFRAKSAQGLKVHRTRKGH